jgi:hypothetical protein
MPDSMHIQLIDNYTNTITDIRKNQNYAFDVDVNNSATYGSGRFSVVFNYKGVAVPIISKGMSTCDATTSQVAITKSSSDFNYQLVSNTDGSVLVPWIQGTGTDMNLTVPSGSVAAGKNYYKINEINRFCSTIALSDTVSLKYDPVPSAATTQSSSLCGAGAVTLTASGAPSGGYYQWYDSLQATTAYPTQSAIFVTSSLTKSQSYYVATVNSLGCESSARTEAVATIIILDPVSISVTDLNTLQSSYTTGNQWYLNGTGISGATNQTLVISQTGDYKVEVNSQGCTVSANKQMVVTEIDPVSSGIHVYPNPVKSLVVIEADGKELAAGDIYNTLGVRISALQFESQQDKQMASYNFHSLASGIYYIRVLQGNLVKEVKVMKE